jgi:hypothetical protein
MILLLDEVYSFNLQLTVTVQVASGVLQLKAKNMSLQTRK